MPSCPPGGAWARRHGGHPTKLRKRRRVGGGTRPKRARVVVTPLLIVACSLAFAWEMAVARWHFVPLQENPLVGPSMEDLIRAGAQTQALVRGRAQYWRLGSSTCAAREKRVSLELAPSPVAP